MGQSSSVNFDSKKLENQKIGPKTSRGYSAIAHPFNKSVVIFGGFPGYDGNLYELDIDNLKFKSSDGDIKLKGSPPTPRFDHSCVLYHEHMFIFGGENSSGSKLDDLYAINLQTYESTKVSCAGISPSARSSHACQIYRNMMIIFGGERGGSGGYLNDTFILNLDTLTWSEIKYNQKSTSNIPSPRISTANFMFGQYFCIFGGKDQKGVQNDLYTFNLDIYSWTLQKTIMTPSKRYLSSGIVRGGTCIIYGGKNNLDHSYHEMFVLKLNEKILKFQPIMVTDCINKKLNYVTFFHEGNIKILIGGDQNSNMLIEIHSSNLDEMNNTMNVPFSEIQLNERLDTTTYNGVWRREPVTIHMINKDKDYILSKYSSEMKIIRKIKHPSVIGFRCITSDKKACVITERVEKGNLKLNSLTNISFVDKISMCFDIARGLLYLHSLEIPFIHGMINDENLFLTKDNHVKIGHLIHEKISKECNYSAPELLNGKSVDKKSDIYSFGLIMWLLYSNKKPYVNEKSQNVLKEKISSGQLPFEKDEIEKLKKNEKDEKLKYLQIMESCLIFNPFQRSTLDSIIKSLKELINIGLFTSTEKKKDSTKLQKYEIVKKIGSGGQSLVFLVKEKITGKTYALKKFNERPLEDINEDFQEIRSYVKISHPNIVNAVDFFIEFLDSSSACQMNLVMDFCDGGDLSTLIKKSKVDALPTEIVKNIINQLVDAIKFIHSKNIIHRDLKPQNIFIMKNSYNVKLGDLGLSRELNKENNADTLVGTFTYMAPEIREEQPYSYSADIWALGIIIFELLTRKSFQYVQYIKKSFDYFKEFEDIKIYNPIYFSILRNCLEIDPSKRLTIEQISDKLNSEDDNVEIRNFDQEISITSNVDSPSIVSKSKIDYSTLTRDEVLKWSFDDVSNWLENISMSDYQMSFRVNEIDGESLLELTTNDEFTTYLKVEKLGHIKKLQKYIKEFNQK
eukprot:gene3116-5286_t